MKRVKEIYQKIIEVTEEIGANHVGAYAAQSAYFFMLCMIPIILLLLTLVQYTPVTKADVMTAVMQVFPTSVDSMMATIVNQVYNQSTGIIPITIIVALWSAGKGVLAMTTGLNCVYHCRETRNYLILRLRSTLYTVMFLLVILFLLLLSVFGNSLNIFIAEHIPIFEEFADRMIELRAVLTPIVLVAFLLLIYKFLPNRASRCCVYCNRLDGYFLDIFCICRCVYRIFQYVRESDYDCAHYAVDVFLYVLYPAWRRVEYEDLSGVTGDFS